ncbi:6-aminohexanoate hydrolase [Aliidiomarina sedimenti]|uniref:6-aminohexanoate hydrolase n=2 Tax=Aliidiomarina sedimenti TaxID=1933879 RepID=A0ABY0C006_9GAMM|nr:6-aminohexanoate hydrolase [Aliidiomarina sedimenti]
MQGFPPPVDKRIMQPESDFFSFPKLRWTVCHIRELMPTTQVSRGLAAPSSLDYAMPDAAEERTGTDVETMVNPILRDEINNLTFTPLNSETEMSWRESLDANYTDGLLVMHKGQVVYEYYSGCLDESRQHAAMSMTKSLTGLLAEILVAEGTLDDTARVDTVVPELAGSAFGDATVRQVMDMTTALQLSENYADPNADIWQYSRAASPLPKPADYSGPNGYFDYLQTVEKDGEHGETFGYRTVNSDALGWIISRTSGDAVSTLLSERIWQHIGAEQDAYMTVDALGTPFAGGGLSAGLRDLARIGQLMLNQGQAGDRQVFPADVVASIEGGGNQEAFAKAGYSTLPGASYRSMWWVLHNENGAYAARGVHGQTIYVDPTAEMVIVRFASFPQASNSLIDPTSLPAYAALADWLLQR